MGPPHPGSGLYQVLGAMSLVNVDIYFFNLLHDYVINVSLDFVGGVSSS